MVIELLIGAALFVAGVGVGVQFPTDVKTAIDTLKAAEQRAQATITQILAHKAS